MHCGDEAARLNAAIPGAPQPLARADVVIE